MLFQVQHEQQAYDVRRCILFWNIFISYAKNRKKLVNIMP